MNEWQPIETAPRDGTEILLFDADTDPTIYVGGYDYDGRYWFYSELLAQDVVGEATPTHWMPLPEPPK